MFIKDCTCKNLLGALEKGEIEMIIGGGCLSDSSGKITKEVMQIQGNPRYSFCKPPLHASQFLFKGFAGFYLGNKSLSLA
jgi:hypothetical protein